MFYLNGNVIAKVEGSSEADINAESSNISAFENNGTNVETKSSKYNYIGSINKKITWKHGAAVAVIAAVIAAVLVDMTGAMVIAKIGYNAIKSFAKNCVGGRVKSKIYEMKAGKTTNYKHIWSFTTNKGKKYGDFTSYVSA